MNGNEIINTVLRASVHRFIGRLGGDPETKFFDSGKIVTRANIAINKPGAKRDDGQAPDWFTVEIWGTEGQAFADQCRKGQLVDVSGRVKSERWTVQSTGEEKTRLVVTAETWAPVGAQGQQASAAAPAAAGAPPAPAPAPAPSAGINDDDIPF